MPSPTLRESFQKVLELQRSWTGKNTPAMKERGDIIRNVIPNGLIGNLHGLAAHMAAGGSDLSVEGRDATGNKSQIPWVRLYSKLRSPAANEGWYCVYLFHAAGDGVYFGVWHATTRWVEGQPEPRSEAELAANVAWARSACGTVLSTRPEFMGPVSLGATRITGKSYENGCVARVWYPLSQIPDEARLLADAEYFLTLLGRIYDRQDLGQGPDVDAPEIAAAKAAVEAIAKPSRPASGRGQGFSLSAPERLCVEQHAMKVAADWLRREGYSVEDRSKNHPYDFEASNDLETFKVEVKGTTGRGEGIILTRNELVLHRETYPKNMLLVVHSISLQRSPDGPYASGGELRPFRPWLIDESKLKPLSYEVQL